MTDFASLLSADERRRLRRESGALARVLVNSDTIADGAKVLAEYRQRFGQCADYFLKYGLSELFLSDLFNRCCRHQTHQVSYLLDEHFRDCGLVDAHRNLRGQELAMFRRYGDKQGIAKAVRILSALNKRP
jgi:hypothetical protein